MPSSKIQGIMGLPFSKRNGKAGKTGDADQAADKAGEAGDTERPEDFEIVGSSDVPTDEAKRGEWTVTKEDYAPILGKTPLQEDTFELKDVPKATAAPKSYDPHAVKQAPTKTGVEPEPFTVADVNKPDAETGLPILQTGKTAAVAEPEAVPVEAVKLSDEEIEDIISRALESDAGVRDNADAIQTPVEGEHYKLLSKVGDMPKPYDKNAPVQGVIDKSHEPTRWSLYASDPKLEDRAVGHEIRCGDHVAYFDPADAANVDGLWALQAVPEKSSDKKTALIRLRTTLAVSKGTPLSMVYQLEKVARMFHDALEYAPGETVPAPDLEACLESWVLEPTRYAPFPDLQGAVSFMHLPVHKNRVVGMALKHRYDPYPEPLPTVVTSRAVVTNVTSTNYSIVSDPKIKFARVSIWNEPARPTHDENAVGKPFEVQGSNDYLAGQ
jgi:hypothetical protein